MCYIQTYKEHVSQNFSLIERIRRNNKDVEEEVGKKSLGYWGQRTTSLRNALFKKRKKKASKIKIK